MTRVTGYDWSDNSDWIMYHPPAIWSTNTATYRNFPLTQSALKGKVFVP